MVTKTIGVGAKLRTKLVLGEELHHNAQLALGEAPLPGEGVQVLDVSLHLLLRGQGIGGLVLATRAALPRPDRRCAIAVDLNMI